MSDVSEAAKRAAIQQLEETGRRIARGNRGSAHVERFDLEDNHRLKVDMAIRHREVRNVFGLGEVTVYDLTTHARINTDIINPSPDDAKFCVDLPLGAGEICEDATEVVRIVAGGLQ